MPVQCGVARPGQKEPVSEFSRDPNRIAHIAPRPENGKRFLLLLCFDTGEEQTGVVMLLHEEGPFTSLGEYTTLEIRAV